MKEKLIEQIRAYEPWKEQEERDKELILHCLETEQDIFLRENTRYHMTASAWVINDDGSRVLMAYHRLYDSWAWLGGHADGETDLLKTAVREVLEESGVSEAVPVSSGIYSLEVLPVNGHMKKGRYVSSHLHLNVTYLLKVSENEILRSKEDENLGVAWFTPAEAAEASSEPWFREHIYTKLNEKLAGSPDFRLDIMQKRKYVTD